MMIIKVWWWVLFLGGVVESEELKAQPSANCGGFLFGFSVCFLSLWKDED